MEVKAREGGKSFTMKCKVRTFREVVCPMFNWLDCKNFKNWISWFLNIRENNSLEIKDSQTIMKLIICGQKVQTL